MDDDRIEGQTTELEGEQGWGEAPDTGRELGEEVRDVLDRGDDEDAIDLEDR